MTGTPLFIRCDAGPIDGLGHLSRCLNLADALLALDQEAPIFLTFDPLGGAGKRIADRGFRCRTTAGRAGQGDERDLLVKRLRYATEAAGRPILVLDSKSAGADYAAACREDAFLVCLDDHETRDLPCDLLINAHPWIGPEAYGGRADRKILAGASYNLIPEAAFAGEERAARSEPPLNLLITLGGEDPGNHTLWVLESFAGLLSQHRVTVVVGPAHPDPDSVYHAAEALPACRVKEAPASLLPLLQEADLAITAGGMTCYELAAARVAQVAIAVEDHQWPLLDALSAWGCLAVLGREAEIPLEPARAILTKLLDEPEARQTMAEKATTLLPRSGLPAVAEAIIESYASA